MTTTESRLGLTNIFKRLAFSFLCKGFGRHPIEHDLFDEVEVAELYPWMPHPEDDNRYGAGIKVSFFKKGRCVRWVEFGIRFIGGGGDPTIFRLK